MPLALQTEKMITSVYAFAFAQTDAIFRSVDNHLKTRVEKKEKFQFSSAFHCTKLLSGIVINI